MGCYMARNGVLHDFGGYNESTWALGTCGAHAYLPIPPKGSHTALYCSITILNLVLMTWLIVHSSSLERPCYMILEVGIAQHRLWRHVLASGAHTCLPIPPKGIITALYYSITAKYGVDDVAYI